MLVDAGPDCYNADIMMKRPLCLLSVATAAAALALLAGMTAAQSSATVCSNGQKFNASTRGCACNTVSSGPQRATGHELFCIAGVHTV